MPMPLTTVVHASHVSPLSLFYVLNMVILLLLITIGGEWLLWQWQHKKLHIPGDPPIGPRRLLTYGLGGLWLLDGLLQAQPAMVTRFIGGYLEPLVRSQPAFMIPMLHLGMHVWDLDPVGFNLAATWLQIGIGALMLLSGESRWRRLALYISIGWSLLVWSLGEAFGSLFAGGSWFLGSPGSALLYALLALVLLCPAERWLRRDFHRVWQGGIAGLWWLALSLQLWPRNGWWTSSAADYVRNMAVMPQPRLFSGPLYAWATSLAAHPLGWNLALSLMLFILALAWSLRPPTLTLWTATFFFTLGSWTFGQDLGVLGGMGTDPNSGVVLLLALVVYAWMAGLLPNHRTSSRLPREPKPDSPIAIVQEPFSN